MAKAKCPYCETSNEFEPDRDDVPLGRTVRHDLVEDCSNCHLPFVVRRVYTVEQTVLKIEGQSASTNPTEPPTTT